MDLGDGPADTDTGGLDDIVEPPPLPHPLLRTAGTHDHPDGPMLGFPIPEHDASGANLGHDLSNPDLDLDLDFDCDFSSLSASAASGEGWVNWRAGHVFGRTSASTDTAAAITLGTGRSTRPRSAAAIAPTNSRSMRARRLVGSADTTAAWDCARRTKAIGG